MNLQNGKIPDITVELLYCMVILDSSLRINCYEILHVLNAVVCTTLRFYLSFDIAKLINPIVQAIFANISSCFKLSNAVWAVMEVYRQVINCRCSDFLTFRTEYCVGLPLYIWSWIPKNIIGNYLFFWEAWKKFKIEYPQERSRLNVD